MISKEAIKKLAWSKQFAKGWKKYFGPARPELELDIYEKYIKKISKKQNPKVLILGSTAEFRDLLLKYKLTPTCCDINPEVFSALKILMKRKEKEIFINSDWLQSAENINDKFDLILGHIVVNMIQDDKQQIFLKNISNLLKKNGTCLTTIVIRSKTVSKINFLSGFERYRKNIKKWGSKREFFNTVYPDLFLSIAKKHNYCTPNMTINEVNKLFHAKLISQKERDDINNILCPGVMKVYAPKELIIEKKLKKYFNIKKIIISIKYYDTKNWPIYELTNK